MLAIPATLLAVGVFAIAVASLRDTPAAGGDRVTAAGDARLVFAEFGANADRIYIAPASDPAQRELIATIEHAPGWGLHPAPEMAGSLVAYTVLPPHAQRRRDAPAELWTFDVDTHVRTRLASDADLLVQPRFDAAGTMLAYRSTTAEGRQELIRVDLDTRLRRVLHTVDGGFGAFPIGFDGEGALVFAELSTAGTEIRRVADGGIAQAVAHISDQMARDWRLSPGGSQLSYLSPQLIGERWIHRLGVVLLDAAGERAALVQAASTGADAEQFGPVWTARGDGVTVGREAYPRPSASAITYILDGGEAQPLAAPQRGFDVPLGWSGDGAHLAVRWFDGTSSNEPGDEAVVVISPHGERRVVETSTEVIFLGWLDEG